MNIQKTLIKEILAALWLPVLWLGFVIVHIIGFSTISDEPGILVRVLDFIVMASCFLLYPIQALGLKEWQHSFIPFTAQFLFWWGFSFCMSRLLQYLRSKSTKQQ